MDLKSAIRSSIPLVIAVALLIALSNLPFSSLTLALSDRRVGDYSFRDLTSILPEGIDKITAAESWDSGAIMAGYSSSGKAILARYDVFQHSLSKPLVRLPPYYAPPSELARFDRFYLLAGESLGTAPVLGVYDAIISELADITELLPRDVTRVVTAARGTQSFLVVLENDTAYFTATFDPLSMALNVMEIPGFENITAVSRAIWNGTALYLGGEWLSGDPALVAIDPVSQTLADLSGYLPGDMDRVDHLIWTGDDLYLLGVRDLGWTTRASMAVYDPSTDEASSLSGSLRDEYIRFATGIWNGTTLILMPQTLWTRTLMAYYPENETSFFVDDLIPPYWEYVAMIPAGERILLLGDDGSPASGILEPSVWTWEDGEEAFEGPYRMVYDAEYANSSIALVGMRSMSAALGFLDLSTSSLEDLSDYLGLEDTSFVGGSWGNGLMLLAGANESQGVLYAFDPTSGALKNLTSAVPDGIDYLYDPGWNGEVFLIPGSKDGMAVLLLYNPEDDTVADLSWRAQLYFLFVTKAVAYEKLFVLLGYNERGAAMVTFDPETAVLDYAGNELGELYGPGGWLFDAAWNGESFLVGGMAMDGPVLGLWSPTTGTFKDLSPDMPKDSGIVTGVLWTGEKFVVGGEGPEGALLWAYNVHNGTFMDISSILPPSYEFVTAMAVKDGSVLIAAESKAGRPSMGLLGVETTAPGFFEKLPLAFRDPATVTIFGLSVALTATLGYLLGRREGSGPRIRPPQNYPPEAFEEPGVYPEEYERYPPPGLR